MENSLFALHNADKNNTVVYVNLGCLVWISDDGSGHLLVGLVDGSRFHIQEKIRDLPASFTNFLK